MTHSAGRWRAMILGTAAYMSPEQARGKTVDRRADIWAFGCVLYEMLTGRQTFEGESVSDTLAAILKTRARLDGACRRRRPPPGRAHPALPAQGSGFSGCAMRATRASSWTKSSPVPRPRAHCNARRVGAPPAANLACRRGAAGDRAARRRLTLGRMSRHDVERTSIRFMVTAPPETRLPDQTDAFVISPDGRALAFVAVDSSGSRGLWIRELTSLAARPLPGTDNASGPFWSPDSRSIAFFADGEAEEGRAGRRLWRCCAMHPIRAAAAGARGERSSSPRPRRVALQPSPPRAAASSEVLGPDPERHETSVRFPLLLPDGRRFLFVPLPRRDGSLEVHLGDLESKQRWPITRASAVPAWAAPGYLILVQNDLLQAQKFDVEAHRLSGEPVPLGDAPIVLGYDGGPAVSVSGQRSPRPVLSAILANTRMLWLDRSGRTLSEVPLPTGRWEDVQISPDGQRAAVLRRISASQTDVWLVDLARGVASRLHAVDPLRPAVVVPGRPPITPPAQPRRTGRSVRPKRRRRRRGAALQLPGPIQERLSMDEGRPLHRLHVPRSADRLGCLASAARR